MVTTCSSVEQRGWLALRDQLWPGEGGEAHREEMARFLAEPQRFAQFMHYDEAGEPLGFVEAALRSDYVNGTNSSPVAFLEGLYVIPAARGRGLARELVAAAERWAVERGCSELASDASATNVESHAMHAALGFEESERVVFFRKLLGPQRAGGDVPALATRP